MNNKKNKFEIENIYERKDIKKFIKKVHNPNYELHHIEIPFRACIIGSSGSGKTNSLINLIKLFCNTFQNIYIITKNKDEPLYNYLENKMKKFENFSIKEGFENLPKLDDLNKDEQTLIVIDDLVLEKNQQAICEFFIRARKLNCSLIYISQSFYHIPKIIRSNINYLIIKQVSSFKNLTMIMSEFSMNISKEQIKKIYEDATKVKYNFLLIDIDHPEYRFRRNLDFVYDINNI
jgi:ABC-type dipeptide/oligopeptide/nickel transport system ATPase component